ncbi:hypothetical protein FRB99_005011 [Tulasnella sp. 403]|nr:hypothetical protein FRB99_005011 [Tulasnella sp. 403]
MPPKKQGKLNTRLSNLVKTGEPPQPSPVPRDDPPTAEREKQDEDATKSKPNETVGGSEATGATAAQIPLPQTPASALPLATANGSGNDTAQSPSTTAFQTPISRPLTSQSRPITPLVMGPTPKQPPSHSLPPPTPENVDLISVTVEPTNPTSTTSTTTTASAATPTLGPALIPVEQLSVDPQPDDPKPDASRTPTRIPSPPTSGPRDRAPAYPATIRRSITIDWPINVDIDSKGDLLPVVEEYRTNSPAGDITIKCTSEPDDKGFALRVAFEISYSASIEMRIFNQMDARSPIANRWLDAALGIRDTLIPSRMIRAMVQSTAFPALMLSVTVVEAPAPPAPADPLSYEPKPTISETTSPAAIEAMTHFLDQPGGHDVVFCFPEGKNLYADRYILQRSSRYFRALFEARNREGFNNGPSSARPRIADDSDAEQSPKVSENGTGRSPPRSPSHKSSRSEVDITLQGPPTPVSMHAPNGHPNGHVKYTLQERGGGDMMDDNVFVMNINETSYNTFRAFLYFLYTGFMSFAPLTSSLEAPLKDESPTALEQRRLNTRNDLVGEYMRRYPNRPLPVSPKSVYAVAKKYEVPALEAQALSRIDSAIVGHPLVAVTELFSAFSRVHDSVKELQLQQVIDHWDNIVISREWAMVSGRGKTQPDVYFATVLVEILQRLPPRTPVRTPVTSRLL